MKLVLGCSLIILTVAALAAFFSLMTTSILWVGGFPTGEFRLKILDTHARPVKGAILRVYRGGTHDLAYGNPLDNHLPGQELASDERGVIVAYRKSGLPHFGGKAWKLFWVIPMGAKAPEYDCEITANGYEPVLFPFMRLFESRYKDYEQFPKTRLQVEGKEIEVPVYEHIFSLELAR